jgi:ribosome-binding factor A
VGEQVRAELARMIREELRDPAIGFSTVTSVEMSPDLSSAKVFVSVLGKDEDFAKSVAALNAASGRLRGPVGRNCSLRYAPHLHFVEDRTIERGARIEALLRTVKPSGDDPPKEGE